MIRGFLIVLYFCTALPGVFAAELEILKERFMDARLLASRMVREVDVDQLDFAHLPEDTHRARVIQWYKSNRKDLISDILLSKHIWLVEKNDQQSCGKTLHQRNADIMFSERFCPFETYTLLEAAKLLIGESAHHFPQILNGKNLVIGDEFSDWIKRAVFQAWLAKNMDFSVGSDELAEAKKEQQPQLVTGFYQSSSFRGVLIINADGTIHLGNDHGAYGGVDARYNIKTTPGNPNGLLKKMEPRGATGRDAALEEQRLRWNKITKRYETKAIMTFTGTMIYDLGVAYRGPYECTTGMDVYIVPVNNAQAVNLTLRRPRKIEEKDCKVIGVVEEYIGFKRIGQAPNLR